MHENDPNIQWIRVSPVNYVPSDNVTIFELIKVEILLNLFLCGELDCEKIDLKSTYFESSLEFIKRKPGALVNLMADMLPLLSIDPITNLVLSGVKDAVKSVTDLLSEIKKLKVEKDQEQLSDDTITKDYIEHLINQKGTHLEFDLISEIIFKTIEKSEKKFVLVVDDLDRLDPAHIFRILNIFSAHNNFEEKNKFGFDKVITVCDFENIESIFHHFYGVKTKFNGYIDKFVSFHPYRFENFENIFSFISENNQIDELKDFNLVLAVFVYNLIKKGKTDLRRVFSALNYSVIVRENIEVNIKDQFYCILNKEPIFYFIHFIRQLMPFEDYNAVGKYEIKFELGFGKTLIKRVDPLYLQAFNMIGVYWIASNYQMMNSIDCRSIKFISEDENFKFEYHLDSSNRGGKYYVTNISLFSGKTSELNPLLSDEEIKTNYLLGILSSKVITLIRDRIFLNI